MEEIIQEKISADHLLYVSLKYTKTCDVIINLLFRWKEMIDLCIDSILKHAKSRKKIKTISTNPVGRLEEVRQLFKKDKNFQEMLDLYLMFKKIRELKVERIGEFRKNVTLRIYYQGKEINVTLDQLKIYAEKVENFISSVKQFLVS
jgi:hypothetical protein